MGEHNEEVGLPKIRRNHESTQLVHHQMNMPNPQLRASECMKQMVNLRGQQVANEILACPSASPFNAKDLHHELEIFWEGVVVLFFSKKK